MCRRSVNLVKLSLVDSLGSILDASLHPAVNSPLLVLHPQEA